MAIGGDDVPKGFEELLRAHLEGGQLVPGQSRKQVNRSHYRSLFGITRSADTEVVFDQIEAEITRRLDEAKPEISEIQRWLNARLSEGSLLLDRKGRVSRHQLAEYFSLDSQYFSDDFPALMVLLADWDKLVSNQKYVPNTISCRSYKILESKRKKKERLKFFTYRKGGIERDIDQELRIIIESDIENESIVFDRNRAISVAYYANKLSIKYESLKKYRYIFRKYEALIGGLKLSYETDISEIEDWHRIKIRTGEVIVVGKTISREPLKKHFGWTTSRIVRNPAIKAMYKRLEEEIAAGTLQTSFKLQGLRLLKEALPTAPLNADGLKLNRPYLARKTGLSRMNLRNEPFRSEILREQERRFAELSADPHRSFLHGKVYDFRPLLGLGWCDDVVTAVRQAFNRCAVDRLRGYLKTTKSNMFDFLKAIAEGTSPAATTSFEAINGREDISHVTWNTFLSEFRQNNIANTISPKNEEKYFNGLNSVITILSNAGIFPKTNVTLRTKAKTATHIKNFAELEANNPRILEGEKKEAVQSEDATPLYEEHVRYAKWRLLQNRRPGEDLSPIEHEAFFEGLRRELRAAGTAIAADPVQAITQILEIRLAKLKALLEAMFDKWRAHYFEGQRLLRLANLPKGYVGRIRGPESHTTRRTERALFPKHPDSEQGIANLLLYIKKEHQGVFPPPTTTAFGDGRFQSLCTVYGGLEHLQAYIFPHRKAVGASIGLYLIESGANVAVGRVVPVDAIEQSDAPGFSKVTSEKGKAGAKPIFTDLRDDGAAITSMKFLAETLTIARKAAPPEVSKLLYVRRSGYKIAEASSVWFLAFFKELLAADEDLAQLSITPNMIRPTVSLLHSLKNDGSLRIGMAYAQHGENVAGIYQIREPTKYLYEEKWRHFSKQVQTLTIYDRKAAREFLGIDDRKNLDDIAELKRTGLGGYCKSGGCDAPRCHSCPAFALIAFPEDIADLQIWNESLKEAENEWIRDRVERWEAEWLDWQCFTEVIEEKMQEGRAFRRIWKEASSIKEARKADPNFCPPRPY